MHSDTPIQHGSESAAENVIPETATIKQPLQRRDFQEDASVLLTTEEATQNNDLLEGKPIADSTGEIHPIDVEMSTISTETQSDALVKGKDQASEEPPDLRLNNSGEINREQLTVDVPATRTRCELILCPRPKLIEL